ncbi:hypothetical protein HDU92_003699 [Lobulomyces angularis]|nr:hypothetical protein HDU92_003699 [Lobulomyces angularis]
MVFRPLFRAQFFRHFKRTFHSSFVVNHIEKSTEGLKVNYILPDGNKVTVFAKKGQNLMDIAHANDIGDHNYNIINLFTFFIYLYISITDLEGACEGSLACSTCHVIVEENFYDKLEEPNDEENDMLDLAFGLTETSRLGCQVEMDEELDGIIVKIPAATRNVQQDKL